MKRLLLAAGILLTGYSSMHARIVTSQNNGNATNPFTWNCTCIPVNGDTIIINHAVTLDVDYAFTMGGIQINAGGSLTGNASNRIFGVSGGYFVNNGTLSMAWVYHNGGTFTNNGTMTVTRSMGIDAAVTNVNNGTITITDTMAINTPSTFQNAGIMNCPVFLNAGTCNNMGTTTCNNFWNSGTVMHTSGAMNFSMSIFNSGNITFNAPATVTQDIFNSENFTVNYFMTARSLYNGDSIQLTAFFTNNAYISLSNDLLNSEDLTGNGHFCVGDTTWNSGNVTGTLDICDQTGGGWDLNFGTEAGTVTHCSSGPCVQSVAEYKSAVMLLSPNPANEELTIQLPQSETGTIEVIDVTGRVVMTEEIAGQATQLNVSTLPDGLYTVVVHAQANSYTSRFIRQ